MICFDCKRQIAEDHHGGSLIMYDKRWDFCDKHRPTVVEMGDEEMYLQLKGSVSSNNWIHLGKLCDVINMDEEGIL